MSTATTKPAQPQTPALLTAEEFFRLYEDENVELVNGIVVENEMPPSPRHGKVCAKATFLIASHVYAHDLGHVMSNDSAVILTRDPDTVRGADVSFYSYARLPKGDVPEGLLPAVPELVVEIRSPSNTWPKLLFKRDQYLAGGVRVVVVLEPEKSTATVYRSGENPEPISGDTPLALPDVLPGFAVPVRRFFE